MTQPIEVHGNMKPLYEILRVETFSSYINYAQIHISVEEAYSIEDRNVTYALTYACMEASASLKLKTSCCMNKLYLAQ
jgi:hypothetical protein